VRFKAPTGVSTKVLRFPDDRHSRILQNTATLPQKLQGITPHKWAISNKVTVLQYLQEVSTGVILESMTMMMTITGVKCTELGQFRVEHVLICVSHVAFRQCESLLL
jgi:hypothetical protein